MRARLVREQQGRCARCGRRIPPGTGELHHVDSDPANDQPANLVLVHAACNPRGGGLHKRLVGSVAASTGAQMLA
jgi:hypothetical protein